MKVLKAICLVFVIGMAATFLYSVFKPKRYIVVGRKYEEK